MVKNPKERTMVERQTLCEILRGGAGTIEHGRGVKFLRRVGGGWVVRLDDGEIFHADILVGES